ETYRLLSEVLIGPTTEFWYPAVSRAKYYGVAERHTRWRRELPVDDLGRPDLSDFMLSRAPKVLMIEPDQASPMGATLSEAERVTLVEEARRAGAFVIEDLYCRLLLTEEPPRPLMSLDPAKDSVILIGGLPMWLNSLGSLSFVIANERIINLLRASGRRDYLLPDVCAQLVAMKLNDLGLIPEMLARFRAFHRAHIEGVDRILREAFGDRFSWRVPAGFGNVWLDLRGVDVERLWRHRRGVDFQPGWFYGEKEPRHLVLRYTVPLPMFEEGVRRLRANIEAL
ncbi:hypothetical protein, partial [Sutterella sp.]|uniref:hypothetical protein n=1 Tax=Sutterella sp. TaxID=1981025 RepID=UPI0026E06F5E